MIFFLVPSVFKALSFFNLTAHLSASKVATIHKLIGLTLRVFWIP